MLTPALDLRALLGDTPLIDGHNDLPAALRATAGYSVAGLGAVRPELHTDLVRMRRGCVGAQFWSVWVPSDLPDGEAAVATLEQIDAVNRLVAHYPDQLAPASTAADIERAFASGRIASLIGMEGGHSIAGSLGALRMFARLGVRYMTLTHNDDTPWAASATGRRQTTGLNAEGNAIVAEMNRIGMIVDLSHTAESTQLDALRQTTAPVIFSHSSARAVTEHPRNVSDHVLSELAANGGVVQITFVPEFVSQRCADWEREVLSRRAASGPRAVFASAPSPGESASSAAHRNHLVRAASESVNEEQPSGVDEWLERHPMPKAHVRDVADHLDHARDVAGIDHVGIGGDYDGTSVLPVGLENVGGYPQLFRELSERHWTGDDLRKLAGRNMLRVMRDVENSAAEPLWPGGRASAR